MEGHEEREEIIRTLRDVLATLPSVRVAYLYGSVLSREDFRDIDIALLIDTALDENQMLAYAARAGDLSRKGIGLPA